MHARAPVAVDAITNATVDTAAAGVRTDCTTRDGEAGDIRTGADARAASWTKVPMAALAALAALDLYIGGLFVSVWLITALVSRYSSLSALLAMLVCVGAGFVMLDDITTQLAVLLLGALVWSRHHANIGRLLTGKETKIGEHRT